DDLRLEHDLAARGLMDLLEILGNRAELVRHRARKDDARLRIHDDLPSGAIADDRVQRVLQIGPKVREARGVDDRARVALLLLVLARDRLPRDELVLTALATALRDLARAHARTRHALANEIQIVDLVDARLQRR